MSSPEVKVVFDAKALLGRGLYYDCNNDELIWVDVLAKTINFLKLCDGNNRSFQFTEPSVSAIPCKSGKNVVALIGRKICLMDRVTGNLKELCTIEEDKPDNRFNEAKCDRIGRLWCGTRGLEDPPGVFRDKQAKLYSYDGVILKDQVSDITCSNGLAWSVDWSTMYFIDTAPKKVYSSKYDEESGSLSDQKVIIDYASDSLLGWPDGMCRDSEGMLWIADFFGSGRVTRWNPQTGEKLGQIPTIPTNRPTSCFFGGPNYDILYVTSACAGIESDEQAQYPHSGAIFAVTGLGVTGLPPSQFDDSKC